jgi:putative ABC transport system permease protein
MQTLWQDLRYGARTLAKQPVFTFIAVLTLALGIGANSAIFSVVNTVLLSDLPFRDADQLVVVWETIPNIGLQRNTPANPTFLSWQEQNKVFTGMASWRTQVSNLTGAGEPEQIRGQLATTNIFDVLGASPQHGRSFLPEEDQRGNHRVAVISHSLWQRRFAGDPRIVGNMMKIDDADYMVIGVMPANFQGPLIMPGFEPEFWAPVAFSPEDRRDQSRNLFVIARMKPGVRVTEAQAEMEALTATLQDPNPRARFRFGVNVAALYEERVGNLRRALAVLLAAAGFVLLIACANVANLLLARASARNRETAIRAALGAGRWRLIQQFLTESLILAVAGGGGGLLLAWWGVAALSAVLPRSLAQARTISLDMRVLGFTLAATAVTGLLCGLVPAFQGARANLNEALKEGGRDAIGGRSFTRNLFVVAEVALAVILLAGAGLMLRSFLRLNKIEMGFDGSNLLTINLSLPSKRYPNPQKRAAFFDQVLPRLAALPGVEGVGAISGLPISFQGGGSTFHIEGRAEPNHLTPLSTYRIINADYFRTLRIPVVKGRAFSDQDVSTSETVAIISESLARISWPNEDPLGRRIKWGPDGKPMTIVGIVRDIKLHQLSEPRPHVYMPYPQAPFQPYEIALRSADPLNLISAVRREVWAVDRDLPLADIRTMESILAGAIERPRFNLLLLGIFAALAIVLAAVGIYGVMSYAVAQSTREIGIRMALGAGSRDVLKLIVGKGVVLTLAGLGLGLIGALALTRLMATLLYGITPNDPLSLGGAAMILLAIAMVACYQPARRATRVDPLVALRCE